MDHFLHYLPSATVLATIFVREHAQRVGIEANHCSRRPPPRDFDLKGCKLVGHIARFAARM